MIGNKQIKNIYLGRKWHRFLLLCLCLSIEFFLTSCPEPIDNEIECGAHQIEVNGTCECEEGYHWNEDETQCLLDTTSHEFMWIIDSLGTNTISSLKDVAIIPARPPSEGAGGDENNIWVVGEIATADSFHNAAHWDGSEWELIQLLFPLCPGGEGTFPGKAIYAFSTDDIRLTDGGSLVYWNGLSYQQDCSINPYLDGAISAIWGTSSSNLYFAGGNGSIVYYNGTTFTKMNSGTTIDLYDISGIDDRVFITGYSQQGESIALELSAGSGKDGSWRTLFTSSNYLGDPGNGDYGRFLAVHVLADTAYFTTGGTWLVKYNYETETVSYVPKYEFFQDGYRFISITGNNPNDLILVSAWGSVFHYNGVDWYYDDYIYNNFGSQNFYPRAAVLKDEMAVIVGVLGAGYRGIAIRGYRMK